VCPWSIKSRVTKAGCRFPLEPVGCLRNLDLPRVCKKEHYGSAGDLPTRKRELNMFYKTGGDQHTNNFHQRWGTNLVGILIPSNSAIGGGKKKAPSGARKNKTGGDSNFLTKTELFRGFAQVIGKSATRFPPGRQLGWD